MDTIKIQTKKRHLDRDAKQKNKLNYKIFNFRQTKDNPLPVGLRSLIVHYYNFDARGVEFYTMNKIIQKL